jgi:hypothetical protein
MALPSRCQAKLPGVFLALAAIYLLASCCTSFVPAPRSRTPLHSANAALLAATAAAGVPLTAYADLPPLEEESMVEEKPVYEIMGIKYTNLLILVPFAVSWAIFWVSNMVAKKELEGEYRTYFGAGGLPPEGYTNPLDPRMAFLEEEAAPDDDDLYEQAKAASKKKENASSAIV